MNYKNRTANTFGDPSADTPEYTHPCDARQWLACHYYDIDLFLLSKLRYLLQDLFTDHIVRGLGLAADFPVIVTPVLIQ